MAFNQITDSKNIKNIDKKDTKSIDYSILPENNGLFSDSMDDNLNMNEFLDDSNVLPEDRMAEMNEILASSALDQTENGDSQLEGDGKKRRGGFLGSKGTDLNKLTLRREENMLKNNKSLDVLSRASVTDSWGDKALGSKIKSLPVIGEMSVPSQFKLSGVLASLSLLITGVGVYHYITGTNAHQEGQRTVLESRAILQKLENRFSAATIGKQSSFSALKDYTEQTKTLYNRLIESESKFSNSGKSRFDKINEDMQYRYETVFEMVTRILSMEEILSNSASRSDQISQKITSLNRKISSFAVRYERNGASLTELKNIYEIEHSLQKLNTSTNILLLSEFIDMELPAILSEERDSISKKLQIILNGNGSNIKALPEDEALKKQFISFSADWLELSKTVDALAENAVDILKARSFGPEVLSLSSEIDKDLDNIFNIYSNENYSKSNNGKLLIIIGLIILIISLLLAVWIYVLYKDNKSHFERLENRRNSNSILVLLNEMGPLQNGDLTTKITVTEEITGLIADAINATVESLGSLVLKIKDTSVVMRERTKEVNTISISMLEDNQAQSASIKNAAISIKDIASAIRDISEKTKNSTSAAISSREASEIGASQVFESIQSINSVNLTMDDTGKLMSKVQNSSNQISEIVDVLSDITEHTSILASNATVQAAKAGEAGKGFKIVADAIQELANSAADATRRVGALIAAVQTDIQAVGDSINKAKDEVSTGVKLSESAGDSLKKVQTISKRLEKIISAVSQDAISYARNSDEVSNNMENLILLTDKTKTSTEETAKSIAEIAGISKELGESVQSFRVEE